MPKWVVTVPNVGHNLGGGAEAMETLGAFARSVSSNSRMPKESWKIVPRGKQCTVSLRSSGVPFKHLRVWLAAAQDLDFRPVKFIAIDAPAPVDQRSSVTIDLPDGNVALYGEATYEQKGRTFRLCSPTKLIRRNR